MRETIKLLTSGNTSVAPKFQQAKARWKDLLTDIDTIGMQTLADRLTNAQGRFEDDFGDVRSHGQEAMAWAGFSLLLEEADNHDPIIYINRGTKLLEAFRHSYCSGELKADVEHAARYHFIDNPPEA